MTVVASHGGVGRAEQIEQAAARERRGLHQSTGDRAAADVADLAAEGVAAVVQHQLDAGALLRRPQHHRIQGGGHEPGGGGRHGVAPGREPAGVPAARRVGQRGDGLGRLARPGPLAAAEIAQGHGDQRVGHGGAALVHHPTGRAGRAGIGRPGVAGGALAGHATGPGGPVTVAGLGLVPGTVVPEEEQPQEGQQDGDGGEEGRLAAHVEMRANLSHQPSGAGDEPASRPLR